MTSSDIDLQIFAEKLDKGEVLAWECEFRGKQNQEIKTDSGDTISYSAIAVFEVFSIYPWMFVTGDSKFLIFAEAGVCWGSLVHYNPSRGICVLL